MTLLIALVFLIMAIIGYAKDNRIVGPLFVMPFIWGLLLFLFSVVPHSLYQLETQFLLSLSLWVFFFYLFCFFTAIVPLNEPPSSLYHKRLFHLYFYILVVLAPMALALLIIEALKVGPEMFFLKLRIINTGLDEEETFSLGPLGYVFNFSSVLALLFTYYSDRISKTKYYTVLFLAFFLGLITLARTSVVGLILGIFIVTYFKGKIKAKHFAYFGLMFFAFIFLVTLLRETTEADEVSFVDIFSLYLFGGMPAFDTVVQPTDAHFGAQTLRFFYAVINSFGGKFELQQNILPYTNVPELTNVYTVLYPFFIDFGYYGLAVFGSLYGLLYGWVYKYAKNSNTFAIIFYALLFPGLMLQFMGESFFANLSTFLQYGIILFIPQFLNRMKW